MNEFKQNTKEREANEFVLAKQKQNAATKSGEKIRATYVGTPLARQM